MNDKMMAEAFRAIAGEWKALDTGGDKCMVCGVVVENWWLLKAEHDEDCFVGLLERWHEERKKARE